MRIYLGKWQWTLPPPKLDDETQELLEGDGFWCAPYSDECKGTLDVRTKMQAGARGQENAGYGIFTYERDIRDGSLIPIGRSFNAKPPLRVLPLLQRVLGIRITTNDTIKDVLWKAKTSRLPGRSYIQESVEGRKRELRLGKVKVKEDISRAVTHRGRGR